MDINQLLSEIKYLKNENMLLTIAFNEADKNYNTILYNYNELLKNYNKLIYDFQQLSTECNETQYNKEQSYENTNNIIIDDSYNILMEQDEHLIINEYKHIDEINGLDILDDPHQINDSDDESTIIDTLTVKNKEKEFYYNCNSYDKLIELFRNNNYEYILSVFDFIDLKTKKKNKLGLYNVFKSISETDFIKYNDCFSIKDFQKHVIEWSNNHKIKVWKIFTSHQSYLKANHIAKCILLIELLGSNLDNSIKNNILIIIKECVKISLLQWVNATKNNN
jgi:hypothetical protein